ncbi:SDR family NAD(P)-dependent oxidoreductase [Rhizobium sp. CG5]|uniref:SDR family NAD(P)-dependent oxidoreductase n=1 Tax=Rhizobium sp. CG5 TaxID=2726076 RepID=UPI0020333223|nr:SDR family NAD(P)-dependent oxidoreductase [Rhizobium sp. CG5]MCM2473518.1 SDR family NAD(P)-dependent oxidoreductase [Rhizobium sp. CG5]
MTSLGDSYNALIIGASGGIGSAFCQVLAADPACRGLSRLSRRDDGFDVTDETSIKNAAEAFASAGQSFDVIVCATGALTIEGRGPEKTIRALDAEVMARQFALNAIGPALVLKHFAPLLSKNRRAVFAALSARVGSIGDNRLGGWISYRAAKAALNQIIRTSAIEITRGNPQSLVVALHPGTVATTLSEKFSGGHERLAPQDSAARLLSVLDGLGAEESGGFFAYDGAPIDW